MDFSGAPNDAMQTMADLPLDLQVPKPPPPEPVAAPESPGQAREKKASAGAVTEPEPTAEEQEVARRRNAAVRQKLIAAVRGKQCIQCNNDRCAALSVDGTPMTAAEFAEVRALLVSRGLLPRYVETRMPLRSQVVALTCLHR